MNIIKGQGVDFYLTGGTALGRFYLNHRQDFPIHLFDTIKWIEPADHDKLGEELDHMRNDIFYGQKNSLAGLK